MALWAAKHCAKEKILDDCPLEGIVACKDCEYWNKKQSIANIGLMLWGWTEGAYYTVHTGADFYCGDAKVRSK